MKTFLQSLKLKQLVSAFNDKKQKDLQARQDTQGMPRAAPHYSHMSHPRSLNRAKLIRSQPYESGHHSRPKKQVNTVARIPVHPEYRDHKMPVLECPSAWPSKPQMYGTHSQFGQSELRYSDYIPELH